MYLPRQHEQSPESEKRQMIRLPRYFSRLTGEKKHLTFFDARQKTSFT